MVDCNKTVNYFSEKQRNFSEKQRMCDSYVNCISGCPLYKPPIDCRHFNENLYYEAIKIVQMNMCPSRLGLKELEDCGERSCVECWNQLIEESEK